MGPCDSRFALALGSLDISGIGFVCPLVRPGADAVMACKVTGALEKVSGWIPRFHVHSRRPRCGATVIASNSSSCV